MRPTKRAVRERSAKVADVIGIVTRTDVLAAYQGRWEQEQAETAAPQALHRCSRWPIIRSSGGCSRACSALSEDFPGVYLVGGFRARSSAGPAQRRRRHRGRGRRHRSSPPVWPRELGGRVRAHRKFKTAVVLLPPEVLGEAPAWVRVVRRALPRRCRDDPHRVLRLSGRAAPGGARLHPPGPVPPRLHHQRHGHLAERRRVRYGDRLLRRVPRPARSASSACSTT